jgi:hypothetical protein
LINIYTKRRDEREELKVAIVDRLKIEPSAVALFGAEEFTPTTRSSGIILLYRWKPDSEAWCKTFSLGTRIASCGIDEIVRWIAEELSSRQAALDRE